METKKLVHITHSDVESDSNAEMRKMFEWNDKLAGDYSDNERSHLLVEYKEQQAVASSK